MPTPNTAAVVTVTIGSEYRQLAELTHGSFRNYANKFGMDFVVIDERTVGAQPEFEKLACYGLLKRYERLIFVDTDVLISRDCPNLLQIVPEDQFGAYVVSNDTDFHDHAIELTQTKLRDLGWRREYFNTGVMVMSRCHQRLFDRTDPDFPVFLQACQELGLFYDQTWLNYKVREKNVPLFDIGWRFNHSLAPGNSDARFASHIIHCKGHLPRGKVAETQRTAYVLSRPWLRRLLARSPRLTRAYDRL